LGLKLLVLENFENQISVWVRNWVKIRILKLDFSTRFLNLVLSLLNFSFETYVNVLVQN
jgi:hypothetical protein